MATGRGANRDACPVSSGRCLSMPAITMPRLSDTMEEGTVVEWLVDGGDNIELDQQIAMIESDKATVPLESWASGPIRIVALAGSTLPVGATLAWVGDDAPDADPSRTENAPDVRAEEAQVTDPAPQVEIPRTSLEGVRRGQRVRASPLARRVAHEHGIDIATVPGTGRRGSVRVEDVERVARSSPSSEGGPSDVSSVDPGDSPRYDTTLALSSVEQTIARRMSAAHATIPDFQVELDVDLGPALALVADYDSMSQVPRPSVNDMIVKAAALALREFPRVNSSYLDGEVVLHSDVNIGVAVGSPDSLVVPVVRGADRRSLLEIANDTRNLIGRVRQGAIAPTELSGGTFTVSNLGMYRAVAVTSIVNYPEAAILAVGAIRPELRRVKGDIEEVSLCRLRLSCDHRVIYGVLAAQFLACIASTLEQPTALLSNIAVREGA